MRVAACRLSEDGQHSALSQEGSTATGAKGAKAEGGLSFSMAPSFYQFHQAIRILVFASFAVDLFG